MTTTFSTKVDVPKYVDIPTSELWNQFGMGTVIETWRNYAKVRFVDIHGQRYYGIYNISTTPLRKSVATPELS